MDQFIFQIIMVKVGVNHLQLWIIIKQLDLDKILPQVILIENKHLTLHDDVEFRKKFKNKYEI